MSHQNRFWSKVKAGATGDCWDWQGGVSGDGYGCFVINRKKFGAHRFAYEINHGPLRGLWALHTCDNKLCCNPSHLYAGTRMDNARDAVERGLLWQPSQQAILNGNAKLDIIKVRKIWDLIEAGWNNTEIAPLFGVTHQMISKIRRGHFWNYPGIRTDRVLVLR